MLRSTRCAGHSTGPTHSRPLALGPCWARRTPLFLPTAQCHVWDLHQLITAFIATTAKSINTDMKKGLAPNP